jgi:hypothetical protein
MKNASKPIKELIHWIPVESQMPDEGIAVLLYNGNGSEPVYPGYFEEETQDGFVWRCLDGSLMENVTHWAEMPAGPK